jgi:hypothetical protein
MQKIIDAALIFLFFILIGCSGKSYIVLEMKKKNPTEYVFDLPIEKLANLAATVIIESNPSITGQLYKFPQTGKYANDMNLKILKSNSVAFDELSLEQKKRIDNKYDLYYDIYIGQSYNYRYNDTTGVNYIVSFWLHFEEQDEDKTKISIISVKPSIITSSSNLGAIFNRHSGVDVDYTYVEPSTIEEYKILQLIGREIGVKDKMPELILPEEVK